MVADGHSELRQSESPSLFRGDVGDTSSARELAQELEHLSSALDVTGQGVWDYDGATNSWYFSPGWKRMRGIPVAEQVIGEGYAWLDTVHPDDREMVREKTEQQYQGKLREVSFEYRERHRNGHWIWIQARGQCVRGYGDGQPLRIVGTDTDVTSVKDSQVAINLLQRAELRWKMAVVSSEQGLWDHDSVTGERFYSDTWWRMRGLQPRPPTHLVRDDWYSRVHPDDMPVIRRAADLQSSGQTDMISHEYRERHPGKRGGWMWVLCRGRVVARDAKGKPTRIIGTDTDITDIKLREHEFATMTRRLELAFSASQAGVWETDLDTGYAEWDARTCAIFGFGSESCIVPPGTWESFVHPEDLKRMNEVIKQAIEDSSGYSGDYRVTLKDGTVKHIRCRGTIVVGDSGKRKVIGVNWDHTPDVMRTEAMVHAKRLAEEKTIELEAARERLEHTSLHDALTNLPNRRCLDETLARLEGPGSYQPLALLHIDLDRFKQINDTRGHAAGDALLVHTAGLLRSKVRGSDMVARIGGDEFVILMAPAPDRDVLRLIVDRILGSAGRPFVFEGQECRCGVSIGIAESTPDITPRQLLVNADIALYRAKRSGRNCAAYFTAALQAEVTASKQCADDILKGLERDEFVPYYQPQFDAATLEIVGVEALVRWNHPERGLLSPQAFLPTAIDINALNAIDKVVMEKAAHDLAEWDALGIRVPRLSVNVSARRIGDKVLLESLEALPIEPSRLSFELLESIFLDESNDEIFANVKALKARGYGVEIDDFGTGHASIVGLLNILPHQLKIDRQLVKAVGESESRRKLVRSIIDMGKSQNIQICAEGIETAEQMQILRELGCDTLQGYFFALPMPGSIVPGFVRGRQWMSGIAPDGAALREFMAENGIAPMRQAQGITIPAVGPPLVQLADF